MSTSDAGLAWLDALADRYEAAAREIRAARDTIAGLEQLAAPNGGGGPGTAEALRRALAEARGAPMKPKALLVAMQRLHWRTASKDPSAALHTALHSARQAGQAKRVPGGWVGTL